jgi:hypothetical protein
VLTARALSAVSHQLSVGVRTDSSLLS